MSKLSPTASMSLQQLCSEQPRLPVSQTLLRSMRDLCPPRCSPQKARGRPRLTPSAEHARQSNSQSPSCFRLLPRAGSRKIARPETRTHCGTFMDKQGKGGGRTQVDPARLRDLCPPPPSQPCREALAAGGAASPGAVQIHLGSERSSWCGKIPKYHSFRNTSVWRKGQSTS